MDVLCSCGQPWGWVAMRCTVRNACLSCVQHGQSGDGECQRASREQRFAREREHREGRGHSVEPYRVWGQ